MGVIAPERAVAEARASGMAPLPRVVDLERTLLAANLMLECIFILVKRHPWRALMMPFWLLRGPAALKRALAAEGAPEIETLPYRQEALSRLERLKQAGAVLVLASASDEILVRKIADHLKIFSAVVASDGTSDCSGVTRDRRLAAHLGDYEIDDVGQDRAARPRETVGARVRPYLAALRPYQWTKNALVLVPLLAAHRVFDDALLWKSLLAFAGFSLCASAGYVLNDFLDLTNDRHHPRKRHRPLASGQVSAGWMLAVVPALLIAIAAAGLLLRPALLGVLALYFVLTLAYSVRLKDVAILDVLTVAGLYAMRVWGGSVVLGITISPWLLAFCIFIFLSLAMVKRYAELMAMRVVDGRKAHARAYLLQDAELLAALGGASGYLSVLVLALYVSGDTAHRLYSHDSLLWGECVLLLYWISYIWLIAHRARMHDDPLVFALSDRVSVTLIVLMSVVYAVAFAAG